MAKKKKPTLKGSSDRGFATTSTPKRSDPAGNGSAESVKEVNGPIGSGVEFAGEAQLDGSIVDTAYDETSVALTGGREFDAESARVQELQNVVDLIEEKLNKEIVRVSKSIAFERRLAASLPVLEMDPHICDEIMAFALESSLVTPRSAAQSTTTSGSATPLHIGASGYSTPADLACDMSPAVASLSHVVPTPLSLAAVTVFSEPEEKLLVRALTTLNILRCMGFALDLANQAVAGSRSVDLDECLAWLFLHLDRDVLDRTFVKQGGTVTSSILEEEAADLRPPAHPGFSFSRVEASQIARQAASAAQANVAPTVTSAEIKLAAATIDALAAEFSQLMDQVDTLEQPTSSSVSLQVAQLRLERAASKHKVALESAKAVHSLSKMRKLERELIDKRMEAERAMGFDAKRSTADFRQAQLAFFDGERQREREPKEKIVVPTSPRAQPAALNQPEDTDDALELQSQVDETEESLFGDLLDEMPTEVSDVATGAIVRLRSMPSQPKSGGSGRTPRVLLQDAFSRSGSTFGSAKYESVGGGGRVCRSRLTLRWDGPAEGGSGKTTWVDTYELTTIGCETKAQADDLVATVALNCIANDTSVYRTLQTPYRIWWDELEALRKQGRGERLREAVQNVRVLLKPMVDEAVARKEARSGKAIAKSETNGAKEERADLSGLLRDTSNVVVPDRVRIQRQEAYKMRVASAAYQQILPQRQALPITSFRSKILELVKSSSIFVLSGETGCGKSTQLPAMILEDALERGEHCKIYVTEPRRISAISLAERVSQELGEHRGAVGSDGSLIGSAVRLESNVGRNAQLIYATTGIVLRMLEGTSFNEITHLICDEIHERDIQSDFLLIILKTLLANRSGIKVVLMSATVDAERLSAYCNGCPTIAVPGRTFPVDARFLEDAIELCKYKLDDNSPYVRRQNRQRRAPVSNKAGLASREEETAPNPDDDDEDHDQPASLGATVTHYSPSTIATLDKLDEYTINQDLIVRILETVCFESVELQRYSSATLIFLPGLAEIRRCHDILTVHPAFGSDSFVVYPLHSSIASDQQGAVFDVPPKGVRKIVIATNIAELALTLRYSTRGITIPDCTCVIDSGKQREMRFDERRQMSKLVECFVAKSNAKQRRGRAGRVQDGLCFHLFTKARHDQYFPDYPEPEMKRLSLQDLALQLKLMKIQVGTSIEDALSQALDPPKPSNISRAVSALVEVKALTNSEEITPLGRHLARLPLDVHMGKFLIMSTLLKCLDPALTIAATLNSKSPFITPFGKEAEADAAKASFKIGNSDFLTIANAYNAWRRSVARNHHRQFCAKAFLSQQSLMQIEELRQQYMTYLLDSGFAQVDASVRRDLTRARYRSGGHKPRFMELPQELSQNASSAAVLHAGLASGLYPKLIAIDPRSHQLTTLGNNQPVSIHPSSVNFRMRLSELPKTVHHMLYFTIMQSRKLYAWETGAVDNRALVLLCGDADFKLSSSSLYIDRNKLRWQIPDPKTALALRLLREHLAKLMNANFRNPGKAWTREQARYLELALRYLGLGANDNDLVLQP